MKKLFFLAVFFFMGLQSAFASPEDCAAVKWPYARKQPQKDLFSQYKKAERDVLFKYYFYELSHPTHPSLAPGMGLYLKKTEKQQDLVSFVEFLEVGAGIESEGQSPKKILKLSEICEVYQKVRRTLVKEKQGN